MSKRTPSLGFIASNARDFLRDRFNLDDDKAHEQDTIQEIERGVVFRGTNLWILIFAIMVCSVGLNVNSTAVIIGAMLISPLMGPIMGVGLGIGINDFKLIIKALKNLGVAVAISVLTSALYFAISPLHEAQSELLARTTPTLWDVLIAFFGGLAGIVAGSRREKSNAIPGVAIATALMPPLCTAGYGLATQNWNFFFGAFYLFFINGVFISFSTYLIVRFLRFNLKTFEEPAQERMVKRYIGILVLVTIIPSVYTAVRVVNKSLFEKNATSYINQELHFEKCKIIYKNLTFGSDTSRIEISLYGEPIPEEKINEARKKMAKYGLPPQTQLIVNQGYIEESPDWETLNQNLKTGIIEDLYKKNAEALKSREEEIRMLKNELIRLQSVETMVPDVTAELKAQHPQLMEFSLSESILAQADSIRHDTILIAYAKFRKKPPREEIGRMEAFLKARTKDPNVKLILD